MEADWHPKLTQIWQVAKYFRNSKVNNEPISSATEMAEVFNDFFATIGSSLASEIQPSTIEPEFCLQPTDNIFS